MLLVMLGAVLPVMRPVMPPAMPAIMAAVISRLASGGDGEAGPGIDEAHGLTKDGEDIVSVAPPVVRVVRILRSRVHDDATVGSVAAPERAGAARVGR